MRSWEAGSGSGRMGDHPTGVKSERSFHLYLPRWLAPEEVQIQNPQNGVDWMTLAEPDTPHKGLGASAARDATQALTLAEPQS